MSTLELKNILYHQIAEINDIDFLSAIKRIIDTKVEKTIYETSLEQKKKINKGLEDVSKNHCFSDDEVKKEMEAWLKEK